MTEQQFIQATQSLSREEASMGLNPKLVLFRAYAGSETGQIASSKGFVFICTLNEPDSYLNQSRHVNKYSQAREHINQPEVLDTRLGGRGWVVGDWTSYLFAVPEGTVIKLFSQAQFFGTQQMPLGNKMTSGVYVEAKNGAPEWLFIGAGRSRTSFPWLQGRCVVISPEEVVSRGFPLEDRYMHTYDPDLNGMIMHQVAAQRSAITKATIKGRKLSI